MLLTWQSLRSPFQKGFLAACALKVWKLLLPVQRGRQIKESGNRYFLVEAVLPKNSFFQKINYFSRIAKCLQFFKVDLLAKMDLYLGGVFAPQAVVSDSLDYFEF